MGSVGIIFKRVVWRRRFLFLLYTLLKQMRDCRVGLTVVTAPETGTAARDGLVINVLASLAEFERELTASRIAESRARLKARGRRIAGAVPFGSSSLNCWLPANPRARFRRNILA